MKALFDRFSTAHLFPEKKEVIIQRVFAVFQAWLTVGYEDFQNKPVLISQLGDFLETQISKYEQAKNLSIMLQSLRPPSPSSISLQKQNQDTYNSIFEQFSILDIAKYAGDMSSNFQANYSHRLGNVVFSISFRIPRVVKLRSSYLIPSS